MTDLLTIDAGDTLTIDIGDLLTIDGNIINNGTINGVLRVVCSSVSNNGTVDAAASEFLDGVEAHATSPTSILVSWSTDRLGDTYSVKRKPVGSIDGWTVLSDEATGTSYTDTPPLANVKYDYQVTSNTLADATGTDPAWLTTITPGQSVDPNGSSYTTKRQAISVWTVLAQTIV